MEKMTIGQLAKKTGVKVSRLRYYERRGLLPAPPRTSARYRSYPPQEVGRVRFIMRAQALGFTLREIGQLLALRVAPGASCSQVKQRAEDKIRDIDLRIASLKEIREALCKLSAQCRGRGPAKGCPILEHLQAEDRTRRLSGAHSKGGIHMTTKRRVEVFSAGCPLCQEAEDLVRRLSCDDCQVEVLDMHRPAVARRAKELGIVRVPSIVIDGKLADCCTGKGPDEAVLKAAGLGQPLG